MIKKYKNGLTINSPTPNNAETVNGNPNNNAVETVTNVANNLYVIVLRICLVNTDSSLLVVIYAILFH